MVAACFPDVSTHECLLVWLATTAALAAAEGRGTAAVADPAGGSLMADASTTHVGSNRGTLQLHNHNSTPQRCGRCLSERDVAC